MTFFSHFMNIYISVSLVCDQWGYPGLAIGGVKAKEGPGGGLSAITSLSSEDGLSHLKIQTRAPGAPVQNQDLPKSSM